MIDALLKCFDVTVQHRARAASAHAMPSPVNIEPFLGGLFAAADLVAYIGVKNFGAAAGDRAEAVLAKKLERLSNRHLEDALRKMANFNRRESFDVEIRIESAQSAQKI